MSSKVGLVASILAKLKAADFGASADEPLAPIADAIGEAVWDDGPSGSVAGVWTTAYDVNFCTLPLGTTYADGANTIADLQWTGANISARALEVKVYADGLHIAVNTVGSDYYVSDNTAPQLYFRIADLIADFTPVDQEVRVWLHFDVHNSVRNYEIAVGALARTTFVSGDCYAWCSKRGYANGAFRGTSMHYRNAETSGSADVTTNNCTLWHFRDTRRVDVYVGQITADDDAGDAWPDPSSMTLAGQYIVDGAYITPQATNLIRLNTDLAFLIATLSGPSTNGQADDFYGIFKRVRVDSLTRRA